MKHFRRWLLALFTLVFSGGSLLAAVSADTAFKNAAQKFESGLWELAEHDFASFVATYPNSPLVPDAILYQAEAAITNGQYLAAIDLLTANRSRAGKLGDKYLFWIGTAQVQSANYSGAAATFAKLPAEYPASPLAFQAAIGEATARARLADWKRVEALLQEPNGVFEQNAATGWDSANIARGYLLLGDARLALTNFDGAEAAIRALRRQVLDPELKWRQQYLECRLQVARGQLALALDNSTNLVNQADRANLRPLLAQSHVFRAELFEQLARPDDAVTAYENNLVNAPLDQQRYALLRITALRQGQNRIDDAMRMLDKFLVEHQFSGAGDVAMLTLGELQLKQSSATGSPGEISQLTPTGSNLVVRALNHFESLSHTFPNSPLRGKALLDQGWCLWIEGRFPESQEAFTLASQGPGVPGDQAVARFKWADTQFMQNDFAGSITNYHFVVADFDSYADIRNRLFERALYQTVRAALSASDLPDATNALAKILDWYPDGFAGPSCLLLIGQEQVGHTNLAAARELLSDFSRRYPTNEWLPEVRLAVARSYEQEGRWGDAIEEYSGLSHHYSGDATNNPAFARSEFWRAYDTDRAGLETNALILFTNYIVRFPATNELVREAQWWVGAYHFNRGEYKDAEGIFQSIYLSTNWPPSRLGYEAQMMAGRSAYERTSYDQAIRDYFAELADNTNCPVDVRARARFAWADALITQDSTNKADDLNRAIRILRLIPPTNSLAILALGRIGQCQLQLAPSDPQQFTNAAAAFQQITNSSDSSRNGVAARSLARVELGEVLEGMARQKTGDQQAELLKQALNCYLDFIFESDSQAAEPFWLKKAGTQASRLIETLYPTDALDRIEKLKQRCPALAAVFDPTIIRLRKSQTTTIPAG